MRNYLIGCCLFVGLGERILREEKEMREMKNRLLAIEAELQTLYRETGDESEVSLAAAKPPYALRSIFSCNNHLMTGLKGDSEFCFPENLNVPRGEAEENRRRKLTSAGTQICCGFKEHDLIKSESKS